MADIWILGLVSVAAAMVMLGTVVCLVVLFTMFRPAPLPDVDGLAPWQQPAAAKAKWNEIRRAFRREGLAEVEPAVRRELEAFFEAVKSATETDDGGAFNALFDVKSFDRRVRQLVSEIEASTGSAGVTEWDVASEWTFSVPILWSRIQLANFQPLDDGGMMAYTHCFDANGQCWDVRWWLQPDGNSWLAYDYDPLMYGMSKGERLALRIVYEETEAYQAFLSGTESIAQAEARFEENPDAAREMLRSAASARVLPALRDFYALRLAYSWWWMGEHEEAAKACRHVLQPTVTPGRWLVEAQAYSSLGDWNRLLHSSSQYLEHVGWNPELARLRTYAWPEVDRENEILDGIRESLRLDGPTVDGLARLSAYLSDDRKTELVEFLRTADDPIGLAWELSERLAELHDHAGIAVVADFVAQQQESTLAAYLRGLHYLADRQIQPALEQFQHAQAEAMEAAHEELTVSIGHQLRSLAIEYGQILPAYAAAADRRPLFSSLAYELIELDSEDSTSLRELVEAHQQQDPDDPELKFYQGWLAYQADDLGAAIEYWNSCLAEEDDPDDVDAIQWHLRRARYRRGEAVEVLRENPELATFRRLAALAVDDRDARLLEHLVSVMREETERAAALEHPREESSEVPAVSPETDLDEAAAGWEAAPTEAGSDQPRPPSRQTVLWWCEYYAALVQELDGDAVSACRQLAGIWHQVRQELENEQFDGYDERTALKTECGTRYVSLAVDYELLDERLQDERLQSGQLANGQPANGQPREGTEGEPPDETSGETPGGTSIETFKTEELLAEQLYDLGSQLLDRDDHQTLDDVVSRVLRRQPELPMALYWKSQVLMRQQRYAQLVQRHGIFRSQESLETGWIKDSLRENRLRAMLRLGELDDLMVVPRPAREVHWESLVRAAVGQAKTAETEQRRLGRFTANAQEIYRDPDAGSSAWSDAFRSVREAVPPVWYHLPPQASLTLLCRGSTREMLLEERWKSLLDSHPELASASWTPWTFDEHPERRTWVAITERVVVVIRAGDQPFGPRGKELAALPPATVPTEARAALEQHTAFVTVQVSFRHFAADQQADQARLLARQLTASLADLPILACYDEEHRKLVPFGEAVREWLKGAPLAAEFSRRAGHVSLSSGVPESPLSEEATRGIGGDSEPARDVADPNAAGRFQDPRWQVQRRVDEALRAHRNATNSEPAATPPVVEVLVVLEQGILSEPVWIRLERVHIDDWLGRVIRGRVLEDSRLCSFLRAGEVVQVDEVAVRDVRAAAQLSRVAP